MKVYIALQRNHQNARSSSAGFTLGLSSLSRPPWKGTLTRLKKYRWPSHMMPKMMCAHRRMNGIMAGLVRASIGGLLLFGLDHYHQRAARERVPPASEVGVLNVL